MSNNGILPENVSAQEAEQFFSSNSSTIMIDCDFGGRIAPFPVHVGEPKPDSHPLQHQANWLQTERGGTIPPDVMTSFETLHRIAQENNVSFQMLCTYAFSEVQANRDNTAPPSDAFAMAPPETPEMARPEPVEGAQELPPLPASVQAYNQAQADANAAAQSHQHRIESSRQEAEENPYPPTPNQG